MARKNQDPDHPEQKRGAKRLPPQTNAPIPCLTLWLEGPDWRIARSIPGGNYAQPSEFTGRRLRDVWPSSKSALLPALHAVRASGVPCASAIPPLAPDVPFTWCTGVGLPASAGSVATVICTLVTGIPPTLPAPPSDLARLESALAGAVSLVEGARHVATAVQALIACDTCQVVVANSSSPHELRCIAVAGIVAGLAEGRVLSSQSLVGRIMAANQTVNLFADQFTDAVHDPWIKDMVQHFQGQAFIGVPLHRGEYPFGVLMAQRIGQTRPFTAQEQQQLEAFVAHIGPLLARLHTRDSEARNLRLQRLIEHLPVGVLWADGHGQILYTNTMQTDISHYAIGDAIAPMSADYHPYWHRPFTFERLRWNELPIPRTIQTGEPVEMTLLAGSETPAQVDRVILVKTQQMHDEQGILSDVIAVQVDITAQYRAEQLARDRAVELDAIIESITDAVVIYDLAGHIRRFNLAGLELTGTGATAVAQSPRSDEELFPFHAMHTPQGALVPPEAWPVNRALRGEIIREVELSLELTTGNRMVTSTSASPLRDPLSGEIRGAVCVFRDITERHNLDKMKDDFMGIASHELRTPLTSLVLASRLLQKWLGRPEKTEDLAKLGEDIVTQVKRLGMLIDNILDLTRITGSHFVLTIRPTNLAGAIRAAVEEQQHISKRTITAYGLTEPLMGMVDSRRLTQVVANLLANALKYSPQSAPVEITATLSVSELRAVSWLEVAVRDYGTGIPPDRLADVFERRGDVQMDPTLPLEQQVRGLGLGLFIARTIIEAHGGRIWAASELGAGSTFTFAIPLIATPMEGQSHG